MVAKEWNKLNDGLPEVGKKIIMMIKPLKRDKETYNVSLRVVRRRNSKKLEFDMFAEARIDVNDVEKYLAKNEHLIEKMTETKDDSSYFDFVGTTEHVFWREPNLIEIEEEDNSILEEYGF